ncbi:MAG: PAS domain-containing protein [Chloroflexales bacterium]|nr:PAS domain-containing protein [Chloroflexales bacterium]
MADRLRADGADCRRRGKDRRAREESGELRTGLAAGPQSSRRALDLAHVIIRDLDGRILFWNRGAEELYGWTAVEAPGQITRYLRDLGSDVVVHRGIKAAMNRGG